MYFMNGTIMAKETSVDMEIIRNHFRKYDRTKQIITYAEAVRKERYELLDVLAPCINPADSEQFMQAVDNWLKAPQKPNAK